MKADEREFLDICQRLIGLAGDIVAPKPRDIINLPKFPMHHKRAWYILQKWSDKGWYEYGVTLDLGWMTETGMKA